MLATEDVKRNRTIGFVWIATVFTISLFACAPVSETEPPNLLLITVDTLRADRLAAYGGSLQLTPNLDRLAGESVVFTAAFAPVPYTVPSVCSIHTGRYPDEIGMVYNHSALSRDVPTLAAQLRVSGWSTGAVVSNYVLQEQSGLDNGFDRYDARFPQLEARRGTPERIGPATTNDALDMIDQWQHSDEARPFFLWVHYQDPHGPYTPPESLRQRYLPHELARPDGQRMLEVHDWPGGLPKYQFINRKRQVAYYRAGYNGEVRYMDEAVGHLLAGLRERGLTERTIVVFAADHGESLGEDDYWFAHGAFLSDALIRVPLFIRAPGREPGSRDDIVSLVDLHATILAIMGAPAQPTSFSRDLFAVDGDQSGVAYFRNDPQSAVRRFGMAAGGVKYLATHASDGLQEKVTRLATGSPAELGAQLTQGMAEQLLAMQNHLAQGVPETPQDLTDEDRRRFGAIGYATGPLDEKDSQDPAGAEGQSSGSD